MKHKPTPDQRLALFRLDAGYHFEVLAGMEGPNLRCTLVDRHNGKRWASAIGIDETEALAKCLAVANPSDKPQTSADVARERDELKRKLEELQAKGTPTQAPIQPPSPAPAIRDEELKPATTPRRGAARVFDDNPGDNFAGKPK